MIDIIHNSVGFAGSAMIILAYFLLQTGRLSSDEILFSLLNLLGASSVIFSLCFEFNWSAFLLEIFWVVISVIGIIRNVNAQISKRSQ